MAANDNEQPAADPIKPYVLSDYDKRLLKSMRIKPE